MYNIITNYNYKYCYKTITKKKVGNGVIGVKRFRLKPQFWY